MKALVTAETGLIGSHIVDLLLKKGYEVRIFDNLEPCTHMEGKPDWVPKEAEFMQGGMRSIQEVEEAVTGVDVILHQAAYGGLHARTDQDDRRQRLRDGAHLRGHPHPAAEHPEDRHCFGHQYSSIAARPTTAGFPW